jgi:hypothetical protein
MPMADMGKIPEGLRREPRWVCWKRQTRNGRITKLPVDPRTGKMASSTDPSTWASFDEASLAVERWHASGVGFVFGPDRRFTGLDLDHVIADGHLADAYRWVVSQAHTYVEVSPSDDGLHLIFEGQKPEGASKSRKGPVEMYDHDRYFTVTGNVFEGNNTLGSNPAVIEKAYRLWIDPEYRKPTEQRNLAQANSAEAATNQAAGSPALSDADLLERAYASTSGAAIRALMDGDMSAQGNDHSAADMALCSHLAFWCAGDAERIDRIFRVSGLMRDKWDSRRGTSTYGAQTIEHAIEGCQDFYKPRSARPAGDHNQKTSGNGTNICSSVLSADTQGSKAAAEADVPVFDPNHAPSVEGWKVDKQGRLWAVDAEGEPKRSVSSTAPWVALDLVDVDTHDMRALVRLRVHGKLRERAMDRDVLLNQNRAISALAPMGANVSSSNCKEVVRYLTDCERRLGDIRPAAWSVRHLGWTDKPLGSFMPYDAGGTMRFDPSPDEALKAKPFMEPAGTLADWVAGMEAMRKASPAFRTVLAASFASPLVSLVGVQTFIVYLWGRSRSGKTPTLKAAGSVWGDPTEGSDSYFRTFADTPKSIVRAAALLHDVPVIIDELQSKSAPGGQCAKRQIVEDLLYSLSLGHERGALNNDRSMMRAGSWKSLTIATGEIPIVGGSTQQGAANRTLELNAEPFSDVRDAQAMHHLVAAQHGTAGRTYIRMLRNNTPEWYRTELARIRQEVGRIAGGHPQADNVALLALADALASFYVFGNEDWDSCISDALTLSAWILGNATGSDGGDTDMKAIQFIAEWLVENSLHFEDSAELDRLDRWGMIEQRGTGKIWCVFQSVLETALARANFDCQKTLRRMSDEGLLVVTDHGRRFTRQRRLRSGGRIWCVCIDYAAVEELLGHSDGDASPMSPAASPSGDRSGDR